MSKTIATILSFHDQMSPKIIGISAKVAGMSKEMQKASIQSVNMANNFGKNMLGMADKAVKATGAMALVVAGLAVKTGFSEAFDMEGYRVQLITATKDTAKASKLMSDAVKFANATPFETGEIVEATAKMEVYGLSSKRWLSDTADMAGATNKSIEQATEAMADVSVGEFERIKEFGITKNMLMLASDKKYGKDSVINAKGQVVDQSKLMDVLQEMMKTKFKGGALALANTTKGLWSTITGITKTSLATVIGMQADGTIKQGSLLDTIKTKVKQAADTFQKWQDDGTIQKIASNATIGFTNIYNSVKKVIDFVVLHKQAITEFAKAFASFAAAIKIVWGLKFAFDALKLAIVLTGGALKLTPMGWAAILITALIEIALHWDAITTAIGKATNALQIWSGTKIEPKDVVINISQNGTLGPILNPILKTGPVDKYNVAKNVSNAKHVGSNALGTNNWRGGATLVGELGPEIINLAKGSTVTTANKTKDLFKSGNLNEMLNAKNYDTSKDFAKIGAKIPTNLTQGIAKTTPVLLNSMAAMTTGLIKNFGTGITNNSVIPIAATNTLATHVKDVFSKLANNTNPLGKDVTNGLSAGMKSSEGDLTLVTKSLTDKVITAFRLGFDIHSPSKKTTVIGGHVGQGVINGIKAKDLTGFIKKQMGSMMGAFGSSGAGGGQLNSWLMQAMAITGTPMKYFSQLKQVVMGESGGDPMAVNRWDSNWLKGTPSMGIAQMIQSTFDAHKLAGFGQIFKPVDNLISSIRYQISQYGSIANTPGVKSLRNGGGYVGYAKGTRNAMKGMHVVGEDGPELLEFKGGEKVTSADKTTRILGNKNGSNLINLNININGNVIGNKKFAEYVVSVIIDNLNELEPNMV